MAKKMRYNFPKGGIHTRNGKTKAMALCGVTAALAVTIGSIAGMVPVATYVIPTLQCLVLQLILTACGSRYAWIWYASVSILSLLLCPDKEAAAFFLFLGYYPILKPRLDRLKPSLLFKLIFFLAATLSMYSLMIFVLGMDQIAGEFAELGTVFTVLCLVLGCITFLLLDGILSKFKRKFQ